jgi:segregation and condensation protein A
MDYSIKINEFEGPLDLLLHLIKESNISIYDIEINEITKQYLDYLNKMEELNINVASSYLVMAAELMEIKSKSLLPITDEEPEEDDEESVSRENLINKLVEYQKYKDMIDTFKNMEETRQEIHVKSPERISNYLDEKITYSNEESIDDLVNAFKDFLQRLDKEKPITTKITNKEYSIKERKAKIKNILKEKKKVLFTELFEVHNTSFIVVTFLSILEMVKEKEVIIKQDGNFKDITIELGGKR